MRTTVVRLLTAIALICTLSPTAVYGQTPCRFVLGFAELARQLGPGIVGNCTEDQRTIMGDQQDEIVPAAGLIFVVQRGDAVQKTTRGLMTWSRTFGYTQFIDGVGVFDLAYGTTRRQVWEPPVRAVNPTLTPDPPSDPWSRCFGFRADMDIESLGAGLSLAERNQRQAEAEAAYYLCKLAGDQDGLPGVDCFESAWRSSRGMERTFPGSGRKTYDDAYQACINRR